MFQRLPPIVKSRHPAVKDFIPYHTEILRLKQLYLEMQCSALRCLFRACNFHMVSEKAKKMFSFYYFF